MERFLKFLSKVLGFLGFSFLLASAVAGYIAEGKDIAIVAVIGAGLLVVSLIICLLRVAIDSPQNFNHVTFPDS